jgi:HK97 family phage major capsid protein/HK97 family phage prohead protease
MNQPELPKDIVAGSTASRDLQIDARAAVIDQEKRTVELAFSSETPVERWYGNEVLDHGPKAVRLGRMRQGGALLMDHNTSDQVGVVESVRIDADRTGRAVMRFGKSARAQEIFQDVVDGIRKNVSVGYRVLAAVLESSKDGVETYRITDWEPYEISLVSVPADATVGVGRSADSAPDTLNKPETRTMSEETKQTPAAPAVDPRAEQQRGADTEHKRVADILAIGDQYGDKFPAVRELAAAAVRNKMSVDEFRAQALEKLAAAPKPTAEIGMDDKEVKRYSLVRALNVLANPGDARARAAAAFELECSEAAAQRNGKTPQGLLVPFDVLKRSFEISTRGLTVGTAADGGNLVATDLLSGSFIDLLRNAMVLPGMGAQMLTGLVGNIAIPKQTGAATAYWVTEGNAPTGSKQAIGQVAMSPKTVGAYTDISRKLLLQSSIDVESFVQGDLAKVIGLAIQAAGINGGGTNEPVGVMATSGIGSVVGGTNGAAPTWGNIVDLETAVAVANADVGTLGYLTNAKVRGKLKKTFVDSGSNAERVWDKGDTPLNGYRAGVTNAVPSNLTKGTASGICSAILFGNWADLVIGMWSGLDLTVDPYSNSTNGTVRVVALQDVDVAVRHAESFAAMLDALTT